MKEKREVIKEANDFRGKCSQLIQESKPGQYMAEIDGKQKDLPSILIGMVNAAMEFIHPMEQS